LNRRKFEVVFVERKTKTKNASGQDEFEENWLKIDLSKDKEKEIEEDIVRELVKRHEDWVRGGVAN